MLPATSALIKIDSITSVFWNNIQKVMPSAERRTMGRNQKEIYDYAKNINEAVSLYPIISDSFLNPLSPVSEHIPVIPQAEPIYLTKSILTEPPNPNSLKFIFNRTFMVVPTLHSFRLLITEMHKEYVSAVNAIIAEIERKTDLGTYPNCIDQTLPALPPKAKKVFRITSDGQPVTDIEAISSLIFSGHKMPHKPLEITSIENDSKPILLNFSNSSNNLENAYKTHILSGAVFLFFLTGVSLNTEVSKDANNPKITSLFHNKKFNYVEKLDKIAGQVFAEKHLAPSPEKPQSKTDLDQYFDNDYSQHVARTRQSICDTICLVVSMLIQSDRTKKQLEKDELAKQMPDTLGQEDFQNTLLALIDDILTENTILPTCDFYTEQTSAHTLHKAQTIETSVTNNYTTHSISTHIRPSYQNVGLLPDNLTLYALNIS